MLLDRWMSQHDIEQTTRDTSLIRNHIRPGLGDLALPLLMKSPAQQLEGFYAELRRCKQRCNPPPLVEHRVNGEHDCAASKCRKHVCKPLAASSVRQIHAIISGALTAAARWGWIPYNPAITAKLTEPLSPNHCKADMDVFSLARD